MGLLHPSSRLAWACSHRGGRSLKDEAEMPQLLNLYHLLPPLPLAIG